MKQIIKKPKVFLSHSKKNEEFILKVRNDFQRCQIESWVDVFDIRHGKPWLDAIFENGIPTCDCFLVYLTEHSSTSPMVKKEMDATLVHQLKDSNVAFLPYVSEEQHREMLRSDIQALQVPVWNLNNYSDVLPIVVSEIWRSFFEKLITIATGEEKRKRLELELQVAQNKAAGVFSEAEHKDFSYIKRSLDCSELAGFSLKHKGDGKTRSIRFEVNLLSLIPFITGRHCDYYTKRNIADVLKQHIDFTSVLDKEKSYDISLLGEIDLHEELMLFGLIDREKKEPDPHQDSSSMRLLFRIDGGYRYVYTPKMERFKYWLAYNNCFPSTVAYQIIQE